MNDNSSRNDLLRVSLQEHDVQSLMDEYPKLTRTEISDIVRRHGPVRAAVVAELGRISALKR